MGIVSLFALRSALSSGLTFANLTVRSGFAEGAGSPTDQQSGASPASRSVADCSRSTGTVSWRVPRAGRTQGTRRPGDRLARAVSPRRSRPRSRSQYPDDGPGPRLPKLTAQGSSQATATNTGVALRRPASSRMKAGGCERVAGRVLASSRQISLTWVPTGVRSKTSSMCSLYSPMQPFDERRPILRVSAVPWIR